MLRMEIGNGSTRNLGQHGSHGGWATRLGAGFGFLVFENKPSHILKFINENVDTILFHYYTRPMEVKP